MVLVDWYHCTKNLSAFAGKACCMGLQQNKGFLKDDMFAVRPQKRISWFFLNHNISFIFEQKSHQ